MPVQVMMVRVGMCSPDGCGAALYVHDLDTGITADSREPH